MTKLYDLSFEIINENEGIGIGCRHSAGDFVIYTMLLIGFHGGSPRIQGKKLSEYYKPFLRLCICDINGTIE
jgi:hypothetical protein